VGAQIRLAVRQLDPTGFYIDVGASELIIDGHVAVRSGVSVVAIRERSLVLCDGAELPADLIVYAKALHRDGVPRGYCPLFFA
jgi:hypothetical protein